MSPNKVVNNQMWFVGDPNQPRTTTQLDAADTQSSTTASGNAAPSYETNIKGIQWFELMAYVGGMWYLLSKLVSMSTKLVLSTSNKTQMTEKPKKVSPSDLEGGEQEKLSNNKKLAKLLDKILSPE